LHMGFLTEQLNTDAAAISALISAIGIGKLIALTFAGKLSDNLGRRPMLITACFLYVDIGAPREILVPWIDLPKLKSVWPEEGDEIYMKLRAESDNQLYGRLISENEVAERFTPLKKEDFAELKNKWMEGRPYRLLKVGTFLLTDDGRKVFVHESEREDEPRLGELKKF